MSGGFESMALSGTGGGGRVLDFRRRPAPPRRKKRSVWLALVKPLTTALALVALPGGLAAWVLTSSRFCLRDLVVVGTHRVPAERLRQALLPLRGENLVLLPLARVETLLRSQTWLEAVEIEKVLPDRLRVSVRERRPVALLAGPGGVLTWADAAGHAIAPVAKGEATTGFLVLDLSDATAGAPEAMAQALAAAALLSQANPDWGKTLDRVDVLGEEDFRLHTRELPFPLLVRRGDLVAKVHRFEALLPELGRRYTALESVDLRFPRRIVVQPAAAPRPPMAAAVSPSFPNGGTG